jgi:hypothetical protein
MIAIREFMKRRLTVQRSFLPQPLLRREELLLNVLSLSQPKEHVIGVSPDARARLVRADWMDERE